MRSAHLTSLLEALSDPQVRAQQSAGAVLLLDADLTHVVFANAAARRFLALPAGPSALGATSPAARQIRSAARLLDEAGAARLTLRAATSLAARPVPAALTRLAGEPALVLLAIPDAPGAAEPGVADFAFPPEEKLLLLDDEGAILSEAPAEALELAASVQAFVASGDARARVSAGTRSFELFRLTDRRVLASPIEDEEMAKGPLPSLQPEASAALVQSVHALSIASIVQRWQTRRDDEPAGVEVPLPPEAEAPVGTAPAEVPPPKPQPLRSIWGAPVPTASNAGESDDWHAVPEDTNTEDGQPIELPGAVTLPDLPSEAAPALDVPLSVDEERPAPPAEAAAEPAPAPPAEAPRFDIPPVRFVWQIDGDGHFRSLSPEFAATVGAGVANVIGLRFSEVAERLGFDGSGEIRRLLERRDTWSGRTVLWPVEGTGRRTPIDLAALPVYGRDRTFEGFRGFGIVRMAEHVADETGYAPLRQPAKETGPPPPPESAAEIEAPRFQTYEASEPPAFGRRAEPPAQTGDDEDAPKVIRLEERRRPRETLSLAEEAAFRAIGMKLANRSEAESPGALRFEPATPEEAGEEDRGGETVAEAEAAMPVEAAAPEDAVPAEPVVQPAEAASAETDVEAEAEAVEPAPAPQPAELEPLLTALPMPLLVRSEDRLVFANRALLDLAGHGDLASLEAAGGLEALFSEAQEPGASGEMAVRSASGGAARMRVHLQRIAFRGRSSLLMAFAPAEAAPVREAASDLHHEVEELRAVLDTATDGIVLLDPAGAVRAMNGSAHALFGIGPEAAKGRPLADFFAHESQKTVLDYLETLKDTGLAGILNDGREVIGRVSQGGFIPLFITVGRLSADRGSCVVIRDITHWKRIEEDLVNARRQAEAASLHKSRFLANISHELRTPLNAIIGFADVMATECFGPIGNERYIEYLGDIKRSGHHVLDLVNDLLDISKIEAGKLELTFEAVPLNEVLAEVVALMQPQANRERVIVRSNLPSSVPPVVADRRTIRQIALNLVSNAIRFTPAGGQIIASTTYTAEGTVLMRFRDSGIGMTEREIEIALTPFQQVQPAGTQERGAGTGLGLPLTKAMVEANRATFAIQSTPGEGTLVEIVFPTQRVLAD